MYEVIVGTAVGFVVGFFTACGIIIAVAKRKTSTFMSND
jgi:hypothetical protein